MNYERLNAKIAAKESRLRDRQAALRWLMNLEYAWLKYSRCRAYYQHFRRTPQKAFQERTQRGAIVYHADDTVAPLKRLSKNGHTRMA